MAGATLDLMAQEPKRRLPQVRDVPWDELRRRATIIFLWLQAGWTVLSESEREEVRRLVAKSKGRPGRLTRDEARRLGRIAAKAAQAAAKRR
jgi:hypothetical protein